MFKEIMECYERVPTNIQWFRVGSLTSSLILLEPWLQVNIGSFAFFSAKCQSKVHIYPYLPVHKGEK
jgi:hypothetical protein